MSAWGDTVAVGQDTGRLALFNTRNGGPTRTWESRHGSVRTLTYLEKSGELVSAGDDGTVRAWEPGSGRLVGEWRLADSPVSSLALSPDGALVAAASKGGAVIILDKRSGRQINAKSKEPVKSLVFSDSGALLGACQHGHIFQLHGSTRRGFINTREDMPEALGISKSARALVAAGSSYSLTFWDFDSGALTQVMYAPMDAETKR